MATRKIVLTGGAGFLLSYVAEVYAGMGDHVVMFDMTKRKRPARLCEEDP